MLQEHDPPVGAHHVAELTLPVDTTAPSEARAFMKEAICTEHQSSLVDESMLLVSELVTNSVMHGSPPITILVECDGTYDLKVSVSDGSTEAPTPPQSGSPLDEHGRGLMLVDLVSTAWGVETNHTGKKVWFSIRGQNPEVVYLDQ